MNLLYKIPIHWPEWETYWTKNKNSPVTHCNSVEFIAEKGYYLVNDGYEQHIYVAARWLMHEIITRDLNHKYIEDKYRYLSYIGQSGQTVLFSDKSKDFVPMIGIKVKEIWYDNCDFELIRK